MDNADWLYDIVEYDRSDIHGSSGRWYAFEDAVRDAISYHSWPWELRQQDKDHSRELLLYEAGCQTESGWNCTAACLDPSTGPKALWASPIFAYTLHNCMVFPWIVALLASDRLTIGALDVAAKYNIQNITNFEVSNGWPIITSCTTAYCNAWNRNEESCTIRPNMTVTADHKLPGPPFNGDFWRLVSLLGAHQI